MYDQWSLFTVSGCFYSVFWQNTDNTVVVLPFLLYRLFFMCYWNLFNILDSKTSPANIYLFKVTNKNFRKRCEICSKLLLKALERRLWTNFTPFSSVCIIDFEQVNVSWEYYKKYYVGLYLNSVLLD